MPPPEREVSRWLEKAEHDRIGAEAALERNQAVTDVAAFHRQQAVEKALKAYLTHCGERFERTLTWSSFWRRARDTTRASVASWTLSRR